MLQCMQMRPRQRCLPCVSTSTTWWSMLLLATSITRRYELPGWVCMTGRLRVTITCQALARHEGTAGFTPVPDAQIVEQYAPPTPPAGVHRYVVSLFLQPGSIEVRHCMAHVLRLMRQKPGERPLLTLHLRMQVPMPTQRSHFSTAAFAAQYGLGEPVAATYFTVAAPGAQ